MTLTSTSSPSVSCFTVYCSAGLPALGMGDAFESQGGPPPFTFDWTPSTPNREPFPESKRYELGNLWVSLYLLSQYYQAQANSTSLFVGMLADYPWLSVIPTMTTQVCPHRNPSHHILDANDVEEG